MLRDNYSHITGVSAMASGAKVDGTVNGSGIDTIEFGSISFLVNCEAYGDGTHALKLQESDDDAVYTDCVEADVLGFGSSVSEVGVSKLGYIGMKRYVRLVSVVSGESGSTSYGAIAVKGHGLAKPQA